MQSMKSPLIFALLFFSSPMLAQTELLHVESPGGKIEFGRNCVGVDDQNGDNIPDFLVGANKDKSIGIQTGAVRLYSGVDASLLHTFYGEDEWDQLGSSMGNFGDLNGDGITDFGIAASGDDDNGDGCGSVRVVAGGTFQTLFTLYGSSANDRFGSTMASLGDISGDGVPDFIIGSRDSSSSASYAGAAQVHASDGALLFRVEGPNAGDFFGKRVAAAGDITGDGVPDFFVGANRFDGAAGLNTGAVFLFSGSDASLVFRIEGEVAGDKMGGNISGGHDLNGDGEPDFLVYAPADGPFGIQSGRVNAYSSTGTKLFSLYGESSNERFGDGLSFVEDINGDGVSDIAIGSPRSDIAGTDNGAIRFFSGATQELLFSHTGTSLGAEQGINVLPIGDINADGLPEFISGAPLADSALGYDAGRVIIFSVGNHGPSIWTESLIAGTTASLKLRNATPGSVIFGWSLAGGGPISSPWGTASLSMPVRDASAQADASGYASISNAIPSSLSGLSVWFQAVDLGTGTLSNGLAQIVQ
jgi:hypothetical protein